MTELESLVQRTLAGELEAFGAGVRRFQEMAYGVRWVVMVPPNLDESVAQPHETSARHFSPHRGQGI